MKNPSIALPKEKEVFDIIIINPKITNFYFILFKKFDTNTLSIPK